MLIPDLSNQQGKPGDFYIESEFYVYYKTERRRWARAHFNSQGRQ